MILRLAAVILATNLLVIGISCFFLVKSRQQYIDKAATTTQNLSQVLEHNLTGIIRTADLGLQGLCKELERQLAAKKSDPAEIEAHIAMLLRNFPEGRSIRVADPEGDIVYGMPAGMRVNVADRDYFKQARASAKDELIISQPLFGRIDKVWLINMARRINKPDGSFGGVTYLSLPLQTINNLFVAIDLGRNGLFSLRDGKDFGLVTRYPEPESLGSRVGFKKMSKEFMELYKKGITIGSYEAPSALDKRMRIWGFRKLSGGKYYVFVGLAKDEYLSGWYREAYTSGFFLALFFLLTTLGGVAYFRTWKRDMMAEETVRETQARFQAMFEDNPILITLTDVGRGPFVDMNRIFCEFFGIDKADCLGRTPVEVGILSEGQSRAISETAIRDGKIDQLEITANVKGKEVPFLITARFIKIKGKGYALSMFQDISGRRAAEEENRKLADQLHQAQKMESVGRLAGGIAHDFNNLLTPIIGYTEMVSRRLPAENEKDRERLGYVLGAARKAQSLVAQLLGFSRKQVLKIDLIDLNKVASEFFGILRRTVRESVELLIRPHSDPCVVRADRNQIEQILMNLVINAQDAINGVGIITVDLFNTYVDDSHARQHLDLPPGQYVVLAVSDSGCGMDKDTLDKIFEPFFTTKGEGKGTGLGLATVYGLVKQQNGGIWVYSEPGRGTTFKIYFPAELAGEMGVAEVAGEEKVSYDGSGKTVLLAEDNRGVRELVGEFLQSMNFKVLVVEDPCQGLEALAGTRIDLLVADVIMPGKTGPDLYRQLQEHVPGLKAIFMSGYTGDIIEANDLVTSSSNFIQKPFTGNSLTAQIKAMLE